MPARYGPSGGGGGDRYIDILPDLYRENAQYGNTNIKIKYEDKIDSIVVTYEDGIRNPKKAGGDGGNTLVEFTLASNEFITGIRGRSGDLIDAIAFETNLSRYPDPNQMQYYGGHGGREFAFLLTNSVNPASLPDEEIIGFFSHYGNKVDSIGVYVRKRPNT